MVANKVHYGPFENSECNERRIGCVHECIFEITLQIETKVDKILFIDYKIFDVTSTLKVIYSFPANSKVISSPISTNGAQYLTALNSSDSLIQFIV